jgi:mannose-6-phosphate isomerase
VALRKLTAVVLDKVWGSALTEPWLTNPEGRKIGEIWFSAPEALPILVKFLFTSDRLSVQVHPDDAYAQAHGHERGKTEMWHILRAEPGASVALGLTEAVTSTRLRESAINGGIVDLLQWTPVAAGDTFFTPAGTIHAIGGGLVICEIQQLSDVTYRIFDYQREPRRPLHLEESLAVAHLTPPHNRAHPVPVAENRDLLANCKYFRTERLKIAGSALCPASSQPAIYVAISGTGAIGGEPFHPGEAWLVPADSRPFTIAGEEAAFIIASGGY